MNVGFIGIGKIASAVIRGLCTSNRKDIRINISPRNEENSALLEKQFDIVARMSSNQQVIDNSEIIFIALPPKSAKAILKELKFEKHHTIVSFVPFLTYSELIDLTTPVLNICRTVPLPTVEKHECPILIFKPYEAVANILKHIGTLIEIKDEGQLQVLWTLTGLIAPFYDLTEKLSNWAQLQGIEASIANKYVLEMFSALTCYTRKNISVSYSELKSEATTPGGMNDQALNIITREGANAAYVSAAQAIFERFKN